MAEETPAQRAESRARRSSAALYYLYCESLRALRIPLALIFGITFPTLAFLLFGGAFPRTAILTLASYTSLIAYSTPFQTTSISLTMERSLGWNKLLRTTSLSTPLYIAAKFIVALGMTTLSMLVLWIVAVLVTHVNLDAATWGQLFVLMIVGGIPFVLAGIFLGYAGTVSMAQAISGLAFFVLSFTSGMFVPLINLPNFVQVIAPYLPTYHLAQLAWRTVNATIDKQTVWDSQPMWVHFLWLAGYGIIFLVGSVWAYNRDEARSFA